jgi:hypothetical protein
MLRKTVLFSFVLLCACGGSGGGGSPSGNGDSPLASVAAIPEVTRGFAQFTGTPTATAAGDVDGDGADDLVVVTSDQLGTGAGSEQLYVFYRRPTGPLVQFAPSASASDQDKTVSTSLCDVDGDGRKEILVGYTLGDLSIYKPAADGVPVLWRTLSGIRSATVACADLDGDGLSDVVTTGKPGVAMQVLLQRAGDLVETGSYPADGLELGRAAIGDVNGDGLTDVVFVGRATSQGASSLKAYLQTSVGQFAAPVALGMPLDEFNDVSANRLALAPLAAGKRNLVASIAPARIMVATLGAGGEIASALVLPSADVARDIAVRDLNGDGRADIAVGHAAAVGVYYQNEDGSFTAEQALQTYPAESAIGTPGLAYGDFDADGKLDVAAASPSALLLFFQE